MTKDFADVQDDLITSLEGSTDQALEDLATGFQISSRVKERCLGDDFWQMAAGDFLVFFSDLFLEHFGSLYDRGRF